jgi:hypothetical protein
MTIIAHTTQSKTQDTATLRDPLLLGLERYWQTLRHAQRLPARNDLNPSQIDHVLPNAFILQRVAPGTARFRVAGQTLHDFIKMDARGMPFTTIFETEERESIKAMVEVAFAEPAIIGLPLVSPAVGLRPVINGALILLPMRDDKNACSRLLGALVTEPTNGGRARRFAIDTSKPVRHETIGIKLAATQLMPRDATPRKSPDTSLRPGLRLVVNNG